MGKRVVIGLALVGLAACRERAAPPPPPPPTAPAVPSVMTWGYLLERVRAQTARGMAISSMQLDYVRADGTFDPTYGTFDASLARPLVPPPPPPDDPRRPLGAPVPPPPPDVTLPTCYDVEWSPHKLVDEPGRMCFPPGAMVAATRCSPAQIWARALADGAPAAALARLHFTTMTSVAWFFAIDDEPRGVHFSRTYADDCEPAVERAAQ